MKKVILIAGLLGFMAFGASADPCRYEFRSWGGVNADLLPLFQWWTFVTNSTAKPIDMTEMNSNKLAQVTTLWAHLPGRPLPNWHRVTGQAIVVVGTRWRMDAVIQPAPMMRRQATIYLENPPVRECQNFAWVSAVLPKIGAAMTSAQSDADYDYAESIASEKQASFWGSLRDAFPYNDRVAANANGANWDAASDQRFLTSSSNKKAVLENQWRALTRYRATFPPDARYTVDHFAIRTGKQIDGCDVYDVGTAEGLTY
jgi:hypothetical protein